MLVADQDLGVVIDVYGNRVVDAEVDDLVEWQTVGTLFLRLARMRGAHRRSENGETDDADPFEGEHLISPPATMNA
jgi:hypothetical protein